MAKELAAFDAPWTLSETDALSKAERLLQDLGINGLEPSSIERAVVFDGGQGEAQPVSYGYEVCFTRGIGGLHQFDMTGGYWSGDAGMAYRAPFWERLIVCVDESGVLEFFWSDACEQTERLFDNIAVMSPEGIADILTGRMRAIYDKNGNDVAATFTVKELRLCAAVIGEPWKSGGDSSGPDEVTEGLFVPSWEAVVEVVDDETGYTHWTVYAFSAADGGGLVGKDIYR